MPVFFQGVGSAQRTARADADLETVVDALKAAGFDRQTMNVFTARVRGGDSRTLFGGTIRMSSEASSYGSAEISVTLERHTPALRPWRKGSQTQATVVVTLDSGQSLRFLQLKALDFAASGIAASVESAIAAVGRDVVAPAVG